MSHILVVEDSPTQAEEISLLLEAEGHEVATAPDGETGLDLFGARPFDLVVSDILLPGLSGYELCRRLKADPAGAGVPVLLLTALSRPEELVRALECGADHFITKPFDPDNLLRRVGHALARPVRGAPVPSPNGTEVVFQGRPFTITADKQQVLDLLLATYEDAARTHRELRRNREELAAAKARVEGYARLLEDRVRSSEEKYRRLMEEAGDAIFLLDPAGKVLEANRRAGELLGRPWTEVVGRPFAELVALAEQVQAGSLWERLLAGGPVRLDQAHLVGPGGGLIDVDLSAAVVDLGAGRVALVIARDVTARNRLEEQLRQAQKMEALGQVAGGLAHDFNNLLTVINCCSELLLRDPPREESARQLIEDIRQAGELAAGLTGKLLTFSRRQPVALRPLDLNAVVAGTVPLLRRLLGAGIELTCALAPGLDPVHADPGQLEQVLLNLVVNARDAMPGGGTLTIQTREEEVSRAGEVRPGRYVRLGVSDRGCGMDEATLARVFEPFFTTKGEHGTGLGLATVYGIVRQGGGFIEVETAVGVGTTFAVYLPCAAAAPTWDGLPSAGTAYLAPGNRERAAPGAGSERPARVRCG